MPDRFYHPNGFDSQVVTLEDLEAHHLLNVLRKKPGGLVELFDGCGTVARGRILAISKKSAEIEIEETFSQPAISGPELWIAAPKGDRLKSLVEKATELGVTKLNLLDTARATVNPREHKLEKLQQTIISACKQSRRAHLMGLSAANWHAALDSMPHDRPVLLADPVGTPLEWSDAMVAHPPIVLIGPEGGFTEEERKQAESRGAQTISIGEQILRIETAGIAVAGWFRLHCAVR